MMTIYRKTLHGNVETNVSDRLIEEQLPVLNNSPTPTASEIPLFENPDVNELDNVVDFDVENDFDDVDDFGDIDDFDDVDGYCTETENVDSEQSSQLDLKGELRSWALESKISHKHFTSLLKLLRKEPCHSDLPSDSRTLLGTMPW